MKKQLLVALVPIALSCLAGCSSEPEQINPTPASVTYQYDGDDLKEVTTKATEYCSRVGRVAVLRSANKVEVHSVAIFDCT